MEIRCTYFNLDWTLTERGKVEFDKINIEAF